MTSVSIAGREPQDPLIIATAARVLWLPDGDFVLIDDDVGGAHSETRSDAERVADALFEWDGALGYYRARGERAYAAAQWLAGQHKRLFVVSDKPALPPALPLPEGDAH